MSLVYFWCGAGLVGLAADYFLNRKEMVIFEGVWVILLAFGLYIMLGPIALVMTIWMRFGRYH